MEKGEEKLVKIEPKDVYGYRKPQLDKEDSQRRAYPNVEKDATLRFTIDGI